MIPLSRYLLSRLVREAGGRSVGVPTLAAGLAALNCEPDCVVLDLNLPDGRGEDLLRAVRSRYARCQVLVCSGDHSRLERAKDLGPDALLQKPVETEDFATALQSLLDRCARRPRQVEKYQYVDQEILAHWEMLARHHERCAEVWAAHALNREVTLSRLQRLRFYMQASPNVALAQRIEAGIGDIAASCRQFAANHRQLAGHYRTVSFSQDRARMIGPQNDGHEGTLPTWTGPTRWDSSGAGDGRAALTDEPGSS